MGNVNKSKLIMDKYNKNNGKSIKEIRALVNKELKKQGESEISYNFCYNVISRNCLKDNVEMQIDRSKKGEKKSQIITLLQEGKKVNDICRELGTWEAYVRKIKKEAQL